MHGKSRQYSKQKHMFSRDFVMLRRRKKKGPLTLLCGASVETDLVPVDSSVVRCASNALYNYSNRLSSSFMKKIIYQKKINIIIANYVAARS